MKMISDQIKHLSKELRKQGVERAGKVTSSWNIPDDWLQKGDIVITPDSNYGITGHSGIIGKDFTELIKENIYQYIHQEHQHRLQSEWEFIHKGNQEYSNFVY